MPLIFTKVSEGWGSPRSLAAISSELVNGSSSRAAVISSSLPGVLTSLERSRFKAAVGVSLLCH